MIIALAQLDVIPGQPEKNVAKMLTMIDDAKQKQVDLIAFPEMVIGGYLLGDKWLEDNFCHFLMEYNEIIKDASQGITIVFGNVFVEKEGSVSENYRTIHPNKDGRSRKYNAVYIFQNSHPARRKQETDFLPPGVQPKTLLPNYRFFDDERYFFSLQDIAKDYGISLKTLIQPFYVRIKDKNVPIGLEICEDLWCNDYRKQGKPIDSTKILLEHGAHIIINISASPWTLGKNSARDRRIKFLKKEAGDAFKPFFYVNCTGAQNNGKNIITFDGGSTVYNDRGEAIRHSSVPYRNELMIIPSEELSGPPVKRLETPKIAQKYAAIIQGIRHVRNMIGRAEHPLFIIGVSGGVDSSLVASLVARAVGPAKVLAINMPTRYNSTRTRGAASYVAAKLGIRYLTIPIEQLIQINEKLIDPLEINGNIKRLSVLNRENIQAKIRGTAILSNLAGKYNALFTNNGNKLEIALGYATLYGDIGGAVAPIADLTKEEVFAMARYINTTIFRDEIIPEIMLPDSLFRFRDDQIQPSAELKEKQIDPMKFGYHCRLLQAMAGYRKKSAEDIMQWYADGTLETNLDISNELIQRWDIHIPSVFMKDIEWFCQNLQNSIFKRVQAPPIIITSPSAFGYDIRESILPLTKSKRYQCLKKYILAMTEYQSRSDI